MAKIPFEFMFEELAGLEVSTKPMFGCLALYVGDKIVFIQRQKGDLDDGVWVATTPEHHPSLRAEFPNLRGIKVFGGEGGWRNLPLDAEDFETAVVRACELVRRGDPRIGKVPKSRLPKRASVRKAKAKMRQPRRKARPTRSR